MKVLLQVVIVVALAYLLLSAGFIATLAARGALEPSRLDAAVSALRGELGAAAAASQPASQPAQNPPPPARIPQESAALRGRQIELERREREMQDQWELIRAAQVELVRAKEALDAEKRDWQAALARQAEALELSGVKKELEYFSGLKPQLAKELLRARSDAAVVQLLLQMETRTGRKIIESCKTDEERQWIGRILEELRRRNDRQAEVLAADRPEES